MRHAIEAHASVGGKLFGREDVDVAFGGHLQFLFRDIVVVRSYCFYSILSFSREVAKPK